MDKTMESKQKKRMKTEEKRTNAYQLFRAYYKKKLPSESYVFFDDKWFFLENLWRGNLETLLRPALEKWGRAISQDIDPLDIFLLGWHTGRFLQDLEREAEASIRGKLHRTGIQTVRKDKVKVDERFRKIYNRLKDPTKKKTTLNRLLQQEFGIIDICHPNPQLNSYRLKYYRAKKELEVQRFKEELPSDYYDFMTAYLEFLVRHTWIQDYDPNKDKIHPMHMFPTHGRRTKIDIFIHENADDKIMASKLVDKIKKQQAKRHNNEIKEQKKKKNPTTK